MKDDLARIHDTCLEYEYWIESFVDDLANKRYEAYNSRDRENFRQIIPILNGIREDVEAYREYLLGFLEGGAEE